MGIFANEKGTGFDARSFFERLYQCQKYNSRWTIRSMIRCFSNWRHLLFCKIYSYLFWGERLFRCVLQLHAGHDLRYGDFSGPPQRWPYFLHFKGSIFTTPKEPPQRFFLNRHISRYLNFNSQAYFEISIPQHGKKKSIKKPMSKFINYFFCFKKISPILGV